VVQLGIAGIGDGVVVGSGGSAVVFAARADDGTPVAVKLLRISATDERSRKQFEREAEAIGRLSEHDQIVSLLGSGTSDRGEPYLLMPLMVGSAQQTLDDHGPMRWDKALDLLLLVCDAIDHAHSKGVIHRDIKPANILLDSEGRPYVADFGIAKLVDGAQTMSSQIAATPSFAPPERFRGEPASKQSDVYSLAASYVALVTGGAPFSATDHETPEAVMRRVLDESPIALETAGLDVPSAVARVITAAMSKQPNDRPATARELANELKRAAGASRHEPTRHFTMVLPDNLTTTLLPGSPPQAAVFEPSINPSQTRIPTAVLRPTDEKADRRSMVAPVLLVLALGILAVSWSTLRGGESQSNQEVASPATELTADPEPENQETTPTAISQIEVDPSEITPTALGSQQIEARYNLQPTAWPTIELDETGRIFGNEFGTTFDDFRIPPYVLEEAGPPDTSMCTGPDEFDHIFCWIEWEGWLAIDFSPLAELNSWHAGARGRSSSTAVSRAHFIVDGTPVTLLEEMPALSALPKTQYRYNFDLDGSFSRVRTTAGPTFLFEEIEDDRRARGISAFDPTIQNQLIGTATVTADNVNVRSSASWQANPRTDSARQAASILGTANRGDTVQVFETGLVSNSGPLEGTSFAAVLWPDPDIPYIAYIAEQFLRVDRSDPGPAVPSAELRPGEGTVINMGRANWSSGWVQAQILHDLLEELGYEVSSPDDLEFAPDLGYETMAEGDMDFWANSWYPGHLSWWEGKRTDGARVGDHLVRLEGSLMPGGGLQGMLITKSWAEENGVTTLDQINADEALWSQLDSDGNGKGEFYGCPEDWTCDDIMASNIEFAGWTNLEQTQAGYDAMFAEFLDKAKAGDPAIIYTWTPTSYIAQAFPGEITMWLSMNNESVLDDSNPLGRQGGEEYTQIRGPEIGYRGLGADTCLQGPDGCQVGWLATDIEITANKDFLAANPAAEALFREFAPPMIDLAIAGVALGNSDGAQADVEKIAADWIAQNRALADGWLDAAR